MATSESLEGWGGIDVKFELAKPMPTARKVKPFSDAIAYAMQSLSLCGVGVLCLSAMQSLVCRCSRSDAIACVCVVIPFSDAIACVLLLFAQRCDR